MTRQDRAIAALAALRADGWTLPTSTVPIDLLLDTKADALDVIAERDSLRAEVERLEIERGKAISVADFEARIRAEERIAFAERIASWLAYDIHPLHDTPTSQAWHEWASSGSAMLYREWRDAQILAAARGERTLP